MCCCRQPTAKKKNKKGKTLTLTDFLAEDSGGSGAAPSYPTKSTSWADETDDLDGDGEDPVKCLLCQECDCGAGMAAETGCRSECITCRSSSHFRKN